MKSFSVKWCDLNTDHDRPGFRSDADEVSRLCYCRLAVETQHAQTCGIAVQVFLEQQHASARVQHEVEYSPTGLGVVNDSPAAAVRFHHQLGG